MTNPLRRPAGRTSRHKDIVRRAFVLNSSNLGRRVISGATFTFIGIVLRTLLTLGSVAVLARLLSPADFGYIAMATVITEFAALFSNFGFSAVLIQRRVITRLQIDTVFWASVMLGITLSFFVFGLSFFASWLYSDPLTGEILRVLCWIFLIEGLAIVPHALLARLMHFQTEFWIQISAMIVRVSVAITFAYLGFGVWSLVAGSIAGSVMSVVLSLLAVPYWPRRRFHLAYLSSTWKTSGSYFGGGLLFYLNMNVDLALIGRQLGATPLGYYQNARSLTDEVRSRIAIPLQRVLFPAFSAIQHDRVRMQDSVMRSARILAAIIFPIGFGLSSVSRELVPILYGDKWLPMIPILTMLGLSIALRGSTAIITPVFNAMNRVGLALKYNLFGTMLVVTGIVIALPYGLEAVSIAIAITSLYSVVTFRIGLGLIGLRSRHLWKILGPPAVASILMWISISIFRGLSHDWSWPYTQAHLLVAHMLLGVFIYSIFLNVISFQYFKDFKILATKILGRP
ncbi:lipopolysaccharide biosynthesis protein [Kineobactrum sediminis]|uniref:Lipopolysaccharide biosynthesis protein n=1 Tax=Kineobactrum sediminis TaxID=1905677 RepID=A0A2N5XZE2_9GAMM|nr:lipopolysaccharide biosynthesis protein [Kineobactrum sediminis]PLW81518.1 lipopolysaccharide biosynthesis protein [Kineobactrum sediminis]